ncbi:hypothetical protein EDC94DRAFT_646451 [Helicostylum pulchrum]|nr:hypothetical protein EDC94DRAFT_646451 [Helicostylum pulchrum]
MPAAAAAAALPEDPRRAGRSEAIEDCSYEHLCLSYILDLVDPLWKDLLIDKEHIKSYIDSFGQDAFVNAGNFYNHAVSNNKFKFGQDHLKRWVQQAIINAAQLFEASDELMIEDYSEGDLSNFVWQFPAMSKRSWEREAIPPLPWGKNEGRSLESNGRRERKTVGAKVDTLFKAGRYEVGCSEVGKDDVLPIDDKYLDDGVSKPPKTFRYMLCQLVEANPGMINKLNTIGFLMMEEKTFQISPVESFAAFLSMKTGINKELCIPRTTVVTVVKKFLNEGLTSAKPRPGCAKVLAERDERHLTLSVRREAFELLGIHQQTLASITGNFGLNTLRKLLEDAENYSAKTLKL